MTLRKWKSSGLINHLRFYSLFLLTPLFFEHWEILFSHLSAPRTTLSLVYTSRKLRPPSLCYILPAKIEALSRPLQIPADSQPAVHLLGRGKPSASRSLALHTISMLVHFSPKKIMPPVFSFVSLRFLIPVSSAISSLCRSVGFVFLS